MSFVDAALGTSLEVPTIDGSVKIKIDAGTQSGKMLRLRGKGIPDINGYGKGDQLIHVNIWTPKDLTEQEKNLLNNLKDSPNFKPQPGKSEKSFFERMKEFFLMHLVYSARHVLIFKSSISTAFFYALLPANNLVQLSAV